MKIILQVLLVIALFAITSKVTYSQDEFEMKNGDETYTIKKYYLCLLKAGTNRSQDSATVAQIQKSHMDNISRMSKDGVLSIAGPFGGGGELRGIFIFNVKTKEEAEKLAAEDPAVKSGRLTAEVYEWWSAKGSVLK
jgi:uncharacterized protein YciI